MTTTTEPTTPAFDGPDRRIGPGRRHAPDAQEQTAMLLGHAVALALLEKQVAMLRAEVLRVKDTCRSCAGFSAHD